MWFIYLDSNKTAATNMNNVKVEETVKLSMMAQQSFQYTFLLNKYGQIL